jgi:hypothetical protein
MTGADEYSAEPMDRTAWCWLHQIIDCAVEPEMTGPDQPLHQVPDLLSGIRVCFPGCSLPPLGGPRFLRPAGPVRGQFRLIKCHQ